MTNTLSQHISISSILTQCLIFQRYPTQKVTRLTFIYKKDKENEMKGKNQAENYKCLRTTRLYVRYADCVYCDTTKHNALTCLITYLIQN